MNFITSLDTKLFFKINNLARRNKWLDLFGYVGSEWVIFVMVVLYIFLFIARFWSMLSEALLPADMAFTLLFYFLLFLIVPWFAGWLIDLFLAVIIRRHRPHITHPESKLLIKPIANWHSFPSDHTMAAFLIFFLALIFHLPLAWLFLPLALWVALGRVFVGVHYPSDLLGGVTVAGLVAWLLLIFLPV